MPLILGVAVLILLLWAVSAFSKADPKQAARLLRTIGGGGALLFAVFLLFAVKSASPSRSERSGSVCSVGFRYGLQVSEGARRNLRAGPRVCARHFSRWNLITIAARCAAVLSPDVMKGCA